MTRLLHILAITLLIGSAGYAYSTKYETLYYAETLAKMRGKLQRERESVAVAKAEWALLTRPDRLQRMVDRHLDLQPMVIAQLGRFSDIPNRPTRNDAIGAKLETLGVEPATTGSTKASGAAPKRDSLGAKLLSLGLDGPPAPPRFEKPGEVRPAPKVLAAKVLTPKVPAAKVLAAKSPAAPGAAPKPVPKPPAARPPAAAKPPAAVQPTAR